MRLNPICRRLSLEWFAFGPRPPYISIDMPCVRFTPAVCRLCAKQNGLRNVSFLFRRGSGSPIVRSQRPCDYRTQLVHFGIVRFLAVIPTENEETRERGRPENRIGGAAQERFCVIISALPCFPRGVRWGLRAPKPAPKSHWLSGLSSFDSRRGCVSRGEGLSGTTKT